MTEGEPVVTEWANRCGDGVFEVVETYFPVADAVVFQGTDQRAVLLQGIRWAARHSDDIRVVGLTWWTEEAYDPRPVVEGDLTTRYILSIYVRTGAPREELDWGRIKGPVGGAHNLETEIE
jgi:hypothetical protein